LAKHLRRRLKKVQQPRGEHRKAVVPRPVLRQLADQAHLDDGDGFTYDLMYAGEAE